MAPVTFHGGPLHGVTVDADGPELAHGEGAYRFVGASLVYDPSPALLEPYGATQPHVRPSEAGEVHVRPRVRKVTRR